MLCGVHADVARLTLMTAAVAPHTPIGNVNTSDLFAELHRRLESAHYELDVALLPVRGQIDVAYHDFTEVMLGLPSNQRI